MPKLRFLWIAAVVVALVVGFAFRPLGRPSWPPVSRHVAVTTTVVEHQGIQRWTVVINNAAHSRRATQCLAFTVTTPQRAPVTSCGFFSPSPSRTNPNNEVAPLTNGTLALGPTPASVTIVRYLYWVSRQGRVSCNVPVGAGWTKKYVATTTTPLPVGSEQGRWYEIVLPLIDHCFHSFTYSNHRGVAVAPLRF